MPLVVNFFSQFRNGKDTAADYLCDQLNNLFPIKWKRDSLASNVKKVFCENFNVTMEFIEEWKVKNEIPPGFSCTIREGLTKIGHGFRTIFEDIWVKKKFENNTENLVLSDGRYISESNHIRGKTTAPFMKNHNGIAILLYRPDFVNNMDSPSEQEIMPFVRKLADTPSRILDREDIPFDIWLRNNGTKEEWLKKVSNLVIPYTQKRFNLC